MLGMEVRTRVNILHKPTLGKSGISVVDLKRTDTLTEKELSDPPKSCAPENALPLYTMWNIHFHAGCQTQNWPDSLSGLRHLSVSLQINGESQNLPLLWVLVHNPESFTIT